MKIVGSFKHTKIILLTTCICLSGCSLAPIALEKMGVGSASDESIAVETGKSFGVDKSLVQISDIQKSNEMNGTRIYYNANVNGKKFKCFMQSSFVSNSMPNCVKPGEQFKVSAQ